MPSLFQRGHGNPAAVAEVCLFSSNKEPTQEVNKANTDVHRHHFVVAAVVVWREMVVYIVKIDFR